MYLFIYLLYLSINYLCLFIYYYFMLQYSSWRPSFIILAPAQRALPKINAWLASPLRYEIDEKWTGAW